MLLKVSHYYIISYEQNAPTLLPDWHLLAEHLANDTRQ